MLKKIINTCLLACAVLLLSFQARQGSFKATQLKSARVKAAYQKKWPGLKALLVARQLNINNFDPYLRVFKQEGELELWAKNKSSSQYGLLKTWPVCAASGTLGPKRKQGDGQVPEGFYQIAAFNPYSSYHLSLDIGYPNKSDRLKAQTADPGGDIMIHGNCVTIGCIPIQNEPMEELYVLCVEARNRQRPIYTHIYPYRFDNKKQEQLHKGYNAETLTLWQSLKKAYTLFEQNHRLPGISTTKNGDYHIEPTGT